MIRVMIVLLGLSVLGACASLNEAECRRGDWYGIGVEDGSHGRLLSYFANHVKACSKHGITPQERPWREGRERGLRLYCTPENAYEIGRSGRRPNPVCTAEEAADMSLPNAIGREYYEIGQDISELKDDIQEINESLSEIGETNPELTARLLLERARLQSQIRRLERRQDRYASWP